MALSAPDVRNGIFKIVDLRGDQELDPAAAAVELGQAGVHLDPQAATGRDIVTILQHNLLALERQQFRFHVERAFVAARALIAGHQRHRTLDLDAVDIALACGDRAAIALVIDDHMGGAQRHLPLDDLHIAVEQGALVLLVDLERIAFDLDRLLVGERQPVHLLSAVVGQNRNGRCRQQGNGGCEDAEAEEPHVGHCP